MTLRLRVAPEAGEDVSSAVAWTRKHRGVDAADDLLAKIYAGIDGIVSHPLRWPAISGSAIRVRRLQTAPYSILYRVDDDLVMVLVVAHWKRNPATWGERLK